MPHLYYVSFMTNNSARDLHATVTRIKMIQNTICAPLNTTPFQIDNSFTNLYLDPYFEERRISSNWFMDDSCSIYKTDTPCSDISKELFLIDYIGKRHTDYEIEVDVRMYGRSCLENCRFNLSIWSSKVETQAAGRYIGFLQWNHLTSARWIFHRKGKYFRIQLNISCTTSTCDADCKISVNFKRMLPAAIQDCVQWPCTHWRITHIQHASWNDANDFCKKKTCGPWCTSGLPTPQYHKPLEDFLSEPTLYDELMCSKVFIGLQKPNKVRIVSALQDNYQCV